MTIRAKVVAAVLAVLVVGLILVAQDRRISELADELARYRQAATEASADASSASVDAQFLRETIRDREERFEVMSHACARLINGYVVRAERLGFAVNAYIFDGQSFEWLNDYWYGEARGYADDTLFLGHDRAGCGMKLHKPNKFPSDDVTSIPADWREGAELPSF